MCITFACVPLMLSLLIPRERSGELARPVFPNFLEGYGDIGADGRNGVASRQGPTRSASVDTTAALRAAPATAEALQHSVAGAAALHVGLNRSASVDPYGTQRSMQACLVLIFTSSAPHQVACLLIECTQHQVPIVAVRWRAQDEALAARFAALGMEGRPGSGLAKGRPDGGYESDAHVHAGLDHPLAARLAGLGAQQPGGQQRMSHSQLARTALPPASTLPPGQHKNPASSAGNCAGQPTGAALGDRRCLRQNACVPCRHRLPPPPLLLLLLLLLPLRRNTRVRHLRTARVWWLRRLRPLRCRLGHRCSKRI